MPRKAVKKSESENRGVFQCSNKIAKLLGWCSQARVHTRARVHIYAPYMRIYRYSYIYNKKF